MTAERRLPPDEPRGPGGERPDDAPATLGEVRTLRRWLVVAIVWAVAATAIALIALLVDDDEQAARDDGTRAASRIAQVERELTQRIDRLEQQLEDAPSAEDVERLENRLEEAEQQAGEAEQTATGARESLEEVEQQVGELERRIQELEDEAGAGGDQGGGAEPQP